MAENYTLNNNMTFDELHHDLLRLEQDIQKYDYENLTRQQMDDMAKYCEEKAFLTDMYNAYECAVSTAWEIPHTNTEPTKVVGLIDAKTFVDTTSTLCNKNFLMARELGYLAMTNNDLKWNSNDDVNDTVDNHLSILNTSSEASYHFAKFKEQNDVITVGQIRKAIETVDMIKAELDLPLDTKIDRIDMATVFSKKMNEGFTEEYGVFEEIIKKELEEIKKNNLQVVESNDGYVMNTSELDNVSAKELSEKVTANGEVADIVVPKETTVDVTRVGGNVKYEQYDDIGSLDKESGVPTYEEKEEKENREDAEKTVQRTQRTRRSSYGRD